MSAKTKKMFTSLAIIGLIIAVIAIGVKVGKMEKTKELGVMSYAAGTLDTNGKEATSDYALRTGFLEAKKFDKIVIDEKADITYQVFYYNADKELIYVTDSLNADLTEIPATKEVNSVTQKVSYYRVVIKVPESKDKVTLLNRNDYIKQLTVTVKK